MRIVPAATDGPVDPPDLIFQWERRSRARWRLGGIVALSLLAHAVSFYMLQVAYTPTGSRLPPPAQVVMIPLDQPGNDAFARWLAMADPSLIVQPTTPSVDETLALLNFHYVPSYKAARPGFKVLDLLPGEAGTTAPPRPRQPGPVPVNYRAPHGAPRPPVPPMKQQTRVTLTGGIESLVDAPLPAVTFVASKRGEAQEPTTFLVGARPEGGAPFLFLKTKPGNAAADQFAREYLGRLQFRPADGPGRSVRWGTAEFAWGSDIYR